MSDVLGNYLESSFFGNDDYDVSKHKGRHIYEDDDKEDKKVIQGYKCNIYYSKGYSIDF